MKKKIQFVDAQQMQRQHPLTFEAPSEDELKGLKKGDLVKVCAFSERFWAEIKTIEGEHVTARVDNHLLTAQLLYNDIIAFKKHHIYDIFPQPKLKQASRIKKNVPAKRSQRRKGL